MRIGPLEPAWSSHRGRLYRKDAGRDEQLNMASDGARLFDTGDSPVAPAVPAAIEPKPKGPAKPILKGVGLDAPFFDDKNRAFWVLQSIGWGGYFILRSLSGLANSMGAMFIVH